MTSNQVENKKEMTSNEVENCPVCYSELTLKNIVNLRCSHQLCKDCFYNWVDETGKNTCPCCRDEIMKSENFMREEKLRAEVAIERMEFAADVWKEKRDKKRKEYLVVSAKVQDMEAEYCRNKTLCREETYETARVLCLKNKYENKIRELRARVTVSMSPYDCRDYYQKKLDEKLNYADKKARKCFKEVLKEMKEVFACYFDGKGRSSYCEDLLMLIDGMKFTKELTKEYGEIPLWDLSDSSIFDCEIESDEDGMKILNEYDDYCDKMKEKEKIYNDRRRESIGMLMEDRREEEVVYREVDWDFQIEKKLRHEEIDVMKFDKSYYKENMEWVNTMWVSAFPRGEQYLYTEERNGVKVCIKGHKEISDINEVLPPINRGLWLRKYIAESRVMMEKFENEEHEDMNLNELFNELEDGEITEFDDEYAGMPDLIDVPTFSDTESIETIDSNEIHYGFMSYGVGAAYYRNLSAIDWSADVGNNVVETEPASGDSEWLDLVVQLRESGM